uniref:BAALC binder of MAP3K1 and KLF4 n=1 Tax=Callithrix jacchus TaxID=9483 RepID=A0A2R8PFH9_CALJA
MGCGGSRADAIEPRYYESWTRETESTWLTYTDSDAPPSAAAPDSVPETGGLHAALEARTSKIDSTDSVSDEDLLCASKMAPLAVFSHGVLEDGLSSNGVPRSTAPGGIPNPEKKTNCETQCPNPQSLSSGPLTQKQNGLRTTEAKRDAKRMSSKEVTINVTDSIQHMDKSRRITKNCVN